MELVPVRRSCGRASRVVSVALAVLLGWVAVMSLMPFVLGMRATVITERTAAPTGLEVGTVVLTRDVPTSDLGVDDGVRLGGDLVRVVAQWPGVLVTEPLLGGSQTRTMTSEHPSMPQVRLAVPYVGLPFAGLAPLARWLLAGALSVVAILVLRPERAVAALRGVGARRLTIG